MRLVSTPLAHPVTCKASANGTLQNYVSTGLFLRIISCADMLRPGRTEDDINREIFGLAAAQFGTRKYWHVRLVRTGENTVHPIHVKAPDRVLKEDDIAFIDLGPVFEHVEADFARNYVIGKPPLIGLVCFLFTTWASAYCLP